MTTKSKSFDATEACAPARKYIGLQLMACMGYPRSYPRLDEPVADFLTACTWTACKKYCESDVYVEVRDEAGSEP
jgi:hypothetical protein